MLNLRSWTLLDLPWIVFCIYWALSAFVTGKLLRRESLIHRFTFLIFLAAAGIVLTIWLRRGGGEEERVLPDIAGLRALGILLTYLGLSLSIWARHLLGRNWSALPRIHADHQLITSGPYARMRHPIYSGILLALLGTALWAGNLLGFAAFAGVAFGLVGKARREEKLLANHFGAEFERHRKQTGLLIPRLR